MQLFDKNGPKYVRLDDDVSFQILRTNPKLTTNTKLMYDGENLYMDSYSAVPLLSTLEYKHHRVWKTGLFNRDIRNFLLGTNTAAYEVGQEVNDTIILDGYDNQFENMYWCGVESINSKVYPQEMGCIAPLYLRKKLPHYFVIFKIDNPANTNTNPETNDREFNFVDDIQNRMKIVKAFDLREGTPIGNYIKRYVEQRDFKYDQSIYVNFSSHEIYYYGIDKKSGVLSQKVENFEEQLLKNDNTIMKMDDWITEGFERNNLIFPYIINLEFLFDDKNIEEFKFARYFGMYCNDIDLYDLNINGSINTAEGYTVLTSELGDNIVSIEPGKFYYIKDKYDNIFSVSKSVIPGQYRIPDNVLARQFSGFEPSTISTYAERLEGTGKAMMILEVNKVLSSGDSVIVTKMKYDNVFNEDPDASDSDELIDINEFEEVIATFTASDKLEKGESLNKVTRVQDEGSSDYDIVYTTENLFSCKGNVNDIAAALADAFRKSEIESLQWVTAFNIDNKVIIRAIYPGINMNNIFNINFDQIIKVNEKMTKITDSFLGGTNYDGCMFKVSSDDKDMFFDTSGNDRDSTRYLKCGPGEENAEILTIIPYIQDDQYIDEDHMVIITDNNGQYANMSKTGQIEIMDRFYAKLGVLSFFPVRDFDFDTVSSAYGEYSLMKKELDNISRYIKDGDMTKEKFNVLYARFFYENNNPAETEYDYFFENYIPELTTLNKTVPFINKWGYADESKDSCENPYRLNTSKIFDACNFSANTFMQKGDIMEYTHSMPYYVNEKYSATSSDNLKNEYHYLDIKDIMTEYSLGSDLNGWIDYFSKETNDGKNPFDKMFGDTSTTIFTNKRFNRKYSRFLTGDTVNRASTLFRGVKFEIVELDNGKEVHTGKYNDYKFSFIYIPVNIDKNLDKHTVNFIKNDNFKFIVGIVFFNVENVLDKREFNKGFVYASSMGFLDLSKIDSWSSGGGDNEPGTGEEASLEPSQGNQGGSTDTTFRKIQVSTNRKNTKFTFSIKSNTGTEIIKENTISISEANKLSSIYYDNLDKLKSGYIIYYSAAIYENGQLVERIPEEGNSEGDYLEYVINDNMTQNLPALEFDKAIEGQYYMKVNNIENTVLRFNNIGYTGGESPVIIESNVEYDIRITSDTNFNYFTIDGEAYDGSVIHCSGNKTLTFNFNVFDKEKVKDPDRVLVPRNPDVYTETPYTYGGTKDIMYRNLQVSIEVASKYSADVKSRSFTLTQNSEYVDETPMVDVQNVPEGVLNGGGGEFDFQISPNCYWYIRSFIARGYEEPDNSLEFTTSEGAAGDNINIHTSWTSGAAKADKMQAIEMQVCSVMTDEVLYSKRWYILPSSFNNNPSGENSMGDCSKDSYKKIEEGGSVLGAYVSAIPVQDPSESEQKLYFYNRLDIYAEETTLYVYVKSYIPYTLERNLPSYVTAEYVPWRGCTEPEGQPGHHVYKFVIQQYDSTIDTRTIKIKFTSTDTNFQGSANISLTQHNTVSSMEDIGDACLLVQQGDDYVFVNGDDSQPIGTGEMTNIIG